MTRKDQAAARTTSGRFASGHSGNLQGRPRKAVTFRADSAETALVQSPTRTDVGNIRHDGYVNTQTGHGTNRDPRTYTGFAPCVVTDEQARHLRRGEFLVKKIVEDIPEEGMRRGWHLRMEDKGLAEEVMAYLEDLGFDEKLVEGWQKEREAGGAALFPVIDGAQGDLATPLDEGGIGKIKAIHLLEPRELFPLDWYWSMEENDWSRPSLWQMTPQASSGAAWYGTQPIHASRLITWPGIRSTRTTEWGQRPGWGDNVITPVQQVLSDYGLAWGSAAKLLHSHGKETWAVEGLANMLRQKNGTEEFAKHVAAQELAWSVMRMNVIDSGGRIDRSTGTLAGVSDVLGEFKQLVAAAAETPVSILIGTVSSALRSGDDDTRAYYATVQKRRKKRFLPQHRAAVRLCMLSGDGPTRGKLPKIWSIEYPPLWEPDEKEHADRLFVDMQRGALAIKSGIASADDVAESFYKGDTYSGNIEIDWDRRAAQAKIAAEQAAQFEQDPAAMDAMGRGAADAPADGGGDSGDLTDEEHSQLSALQDQFGGGDDVGGDAEGGDEADEVDDLDEELEPEPEEEPDDDLTEMTEQEREDGWREDAGMGAAGYNPYRDKDGKFGAGPHAAKPPPSQRHAAAAFAAAERAGKARGRMSDLQHKIAVHNDGKQAAHIEARLALRKAVAAGELAKAKPTAKNLKAAQVATNKATRAQAKIGKHDAAIAKHTEAHAKATIAHQKAVEAHGKAKARYDAAKAKEQAQAAKSAANKPAAPASGTASVKSLTDSQYKRWQQEATDGPGSKVTAEERGHLKTYSGDDYFHINNLLRSGAGPGGYSDTVHALDSAIAKSSATADTMVYRGMRGEARHVFGSLKPGDVFADKAFVSTTANKSVAHDMYSNGGAVFHITVPKGSHALPMTKGSLHGSEREVLLPRETRVRVDRVSKNRDGTTIIHATVHHG